MSTLDIRLIVDELVLDVRGELDSRMAEDLAHSVADDLGRRLERLQSERVREIANGRQEARPVRIETLRLSVTGPVPSIEDMSSSLARTVMERISR